MLKRSFLATGFLLIMWSSSWADCKWGRFSFLFGNNSVASAVADNSQQCTLHVRTGRGSTFTAFGVTQQAKHGSVSWNGSLMQSALIYTPKSGYRGADDFAFSVTGTGTTASGTSQIAVTMNVQ